MLIAIPVEQGKLCTHFGHCERFALAEVDTEARQIKSIKYLSAPPHEPGVLPMWLLKLGVNVVITGGIGRRAQQLLEQNNVKIVLGIQPETPEKLVESFLLGTLTSSSNLCDH